MSQTTGLTVRQYERESLELPIEFTVCDEHSGQVKFSSSSSAAGQHVIRGTLLDVSPGGMGMQCSQFVPRMSEGIIRVYGGQGIEASRHQGIRAGTDVAASMPGSLDASMPVFEHRVKVRRVFLTDRQPVYSLGLAFVNPEIGIEQKVTALLAMGKGRSHA